MPSEKTRVILTYAGGWATDFGPSFPGAPQNNVLGLPFLLTSDNVGYELDGAPHKFGGTTRLNSTQVTESGSAVAFEGIYDFWMQGTGGSETQKRVAVVGTQIMKEDVDGTWDQIASGLETGKQPAFETFNDNVIIATTSTADVPQYWDGSAATTSNLGGSPPNFSFMVRHKNYLFAAGVVTQPSRLYYSASLDEQDWTSASSGSIDIDPDDGDRIVGLISHKNELFVFKGPNRLSIHRITGSSETDWARVPYVTGLGGINHNTIFRVSDDIVFASPRGFHSLAATAAFGDYVEAFLSRPFLTYYQEQLNHSVSKNAWGCNYQGKGLAIWAMAKSGGTAKNIAFCYDYRFQPGRWATLGKESAYTSLNCLAIMQSSTRRHLLHAGGTDGYVRVLDTSDRSIDTTGAYTGRVESPFLNFGSSAYLKNLEDGWMSLAPKGNYNLSFGYQQDTALEETVTISQAGVGGVLG